MKINEVEALVGIPKKNIRFYEQEGLLSPRRNRENGYRDYGEEDLTVLRRIKLLRKLGLPLEEIRRLQRGEFTVGDAMERHCVLLEREQKSLANSQVLCQALSALPGRLDDLAPEPWLEQMAQMEQEGVRFMNRQNGDVRTRYVGAVAGAGVMILLMGGLMALFAWFTRLESDPMPLWMMAVLDLPCMVVLVGVIVALMQRMKEIQGGEMDAASKY